MSDGRPEELSRSISAEDNDRCTLGTSRDPIETFELAEAVRHQITTLPRGYRRIAKQLMKSNRTESAKALGISKRMYTRCL